MSYGVTTSTKGEDQGKRKKKEGEVRRCCCGGHEFGAKLRQLPSYPLGENGFVCVCARERRSELYNARLGVSTGSHARPATEPEEPMLIRALMDKSIDPQGNEFVFIHSAVMRTDTYRKQTRRSPQGSYLFDCRSNSGLPLEYAGNGDKKERRELARG